MGNSSRRAAGLTSKRAARWHDGGGHGNEMNGHDPSRTATESTETTVCGATEQTGDAENCQRPCCNRQGGCTDGGARARQ